MTFRYFKGWRSAYPTGAIVIWTGSLSSIPRGWVVCDGNNGTPDLQNRFVKGIPDGLTDPGATGGSNTVTLSESQIPAHDHDVSFETDGDHYHKWWVSSEGTGANGAGHWQTTDKRTTVNGAHSHSWSLQESGGGSAMNNEPAHYEALYIMKT